MQTNPFNPTFGDVPQVLVNKHQVPAQDLAQLIESSNYPRAIFITGVRGSGKTVLLTKTEKELARQPKCCVIDLLNNETLIEDLKQQLAQAAANPVKKGLAKLSSLSAAGITLESGASDQAVIRQLLEKIKQQGKYVVVVIDEVDNSPVIREFAQLFSAMKRFELPLFALMTGLPDLVLDVQTADRLTFLLRADKVALSPLNLVAMTTAYQQTLKLDLSLAQRMAKLTAGYSYAFQLLGYLVFETANGAPVTEATINAVMDQYQLYLFENAYQKIFADLSEMDRQYLVAIADNPTFATVSERMQKSRSYVSQYRRRALARHLIVATGYGKVAYTLPQFKEFILATQNPDTIYYQPVEIGD